METPEGLHDVSATVAAIVGAAGAGPPTLPRLVASQSSPYLGHSVTGSVRLGATGATATSAATARSRLLALSASASLQPMKSVKRRPVPVDPSAPQPRPQVGLCVCL
jgi:hypothetical protein